MKSKTRICKRPRSFHTVSSSSASPRSRRCDRNVFTKVRLSSLEVPERRICSMKVFASLIWCAQVSTSWYAPSILREPARVAIANWWLAVQNSGLDEVFEICSTTDRKTSALGAEVMVRFTWISSTAALPARSVRGR